MPQDPAPALDAEFIRHMASEQVRIALAPPDLDAVRMQVNGLLEEIRHVTLRDRATADPEPIVALEDWPT
jgi:hypothetical protein